jgi:alanyl-tRNA synthetase
VLDRTPFYAEMGGQVGDRGTLTLGDEVIAVTDTKRENNLPVHITAKLPTDVNATLHAAIDIDARHATECNHTATHLLHAALRQVLGTHVEQKGSYVDPISLRFDFSHFRKVTPEEIRQVEHLANQMIRNAIPREEHREMPIDEARQMGAMALFGEKYGDRVRVIKYGDSVELCGGTHVCNTGNIGMVRIVSESSIAAGIRRIEAVTGARVEEMLDTVQDTLGHIKEMLNNAPDAVAALQKSLAENADLKKQVEDFMKQRIAILTQQLIAEAKTENDINVITLTGQRLPDVVKGVALAIKAECPVSTAFLAATEHEGKPMLTVMISEDIVKSGKNAGNIVRGAAKCIQGGGGGQPHFAQAGGRNPQGLEDAMSAMREALLNH